MVIRRFLWAAAMGRNFMVSLLSAAKIVSGENKEGGLPLHLAARGGHLKGSTKTIAEGKRGHSRANDGETALHLDASGLARPSTQRLSDFIINYSR
jgi:hypothetical protein